MMNTVKIVLIFLIVNKCSGIPPVPPDHLWEELISAKDVMVNIASQLEKFNSLYLMKLEQRVLFIASMLANIDSNVKNLQERAHIWDTFQLHVSAWNEQINTLDKKVEIISKGQEKILTLDSKVNSISNIEYKTEQIVVKVNENLATLQTVIKLVENQNSGPLFGEFTTRGVLSTLKLIERKMDKFQLQHSKQMASEEAEKKLLIKCNTPPIVEELLNDVSSKVDVLFDKFTNNYLEQSDEAKSDEEDLPQEPDFKLMKSLLKRLNQPCKKSIKVLENLEAYIQIVGNNTIDILEQNQKVASYLKSKDQKIVDLSTQTVDLSKQMTGLHEVLESLNLTKHRNWLTELLQIELQKVCTPKQPKEPNVLKYSSKTSCDDLDWSDSKGVYVFGPNNSQNQAGRFYNHRFCTQSSDGRFWTIIQRRGLNPLEQTFNLSWTQYKQGFGSLKEDFWFGNDFLHELLLEKPHILRVELEDFDGNFAWAEYNTFFVGNEHENYQLRVGGYRGNASDSFSAHNNASFSTFDRTNDKAPNCCPCSLSYGGGWWFYSCFEANLNGVYYTDPHGNDYFRGLIWEQWLGNYSLRKTQMMIRPKINYDNDESGSGIEPYDPFEIPEDP